MILTEEEAKTKRCQEGFPGQMLGSGYMQSTSFSAVHAGAMAATATTPINCIGSACMAWRTVKWNTLPESLDAQLNTLPDDGKVRGYCGKAGKP